MSVSLSNSYAHSNPIGVDFPPPYLVPGVLLALGREVGDFADPTGTRAAERSWHIRVMGTPPHGKHLTNPSIML